MGIKERVRDIPVLGTAMRVQERYTLEAGDQFAGAIGFFGFLSLFPLIILALSVVGFVYAGASDARMAEVVATIQSVIPGLAGVLEAGDETTGVAQALDAIVRNRGAVGLVGLVTLLMSGLRVLNAAQTATLVVLRVDRSRMSGLRHRLDQAVALGILGLLAILGVAAASTLGVVTRMDLLGPARVFGTLLSWLGTFALDVGLFLAAYRLFVTSAGPPLRRLVPGAVLAGFGWTVLKAVGATWVSGQVASANELYGALGGVVGLLLLFYLAGRLFVYGAALSAVRLDDAAGRDPAAGEESSALPLAVALPSPAVGPPAATAPPTSSAPTLARLESMPPPPRSHQGRQALTFAIGVGALAGLIAALRPWESR